MFFAASGAAVTGSFATQLNPLDYLALFYSIEIFAFRSNRLYRVPSGRLCAGFFRLPELYGSG